MVMLVVVVLMATAAMVVVMLVVVFVLAAALTVLVLMLMLVLAAALAVVVLAVMLVLAVVVAAAAIVLATIEGLRLNLANKLLNCHRYSPSLPVISAAWLRPTLMRRATCSSARR